MVGRIRKILAALTMAWLAGAPIVNAAPGEIVAGPHFLEWRPGHMVGPGTLRSLLRTEDGFLVLSRRGVLMKLTSTDELDETFGNGGITWTSPGTTLAAAPDGNVYAAVVQYNGYLDAAAFWLKIVRLNEAGEFIHDWGPGNSLVQVRVEVGQPHWEAFRIHVDDTGIYAFVAVLTGEGETRRNELLYGAWNLDGSPRLIGESNVRLTGLVLGTPTRQLDPLQILRDGSGWLVHSQSMTLGSAVLAARLSDSGEVDPGFGTSGITAAPVASGEAFATRLGNVLYVLESRFDWTTGEENVWLRRYDDSGQLDSVYGEKLVAGLPGSTPDRTVHPLGLFKRGQSLDLWLEVQQGGDYELSAWPLDLSSGLVTAGEHFPVECMDDCRLLWSETKVVPAMRSGSLAFIHYPSGEGPRVVGVPFLDEPDLGVPVRTLGQGLDDQILWTQLSGAPLTRTDLEGNIDAAFGAGRSQLSDSDDLSDRFVTAAMLENDGELGLITFPTTFGCPVSGAEGGVINDGGPEALYVKVTPNGDFDPESQINLRERLDAVAGSAATCPSWISALQYGEDGLDLANEGKILRLSGDELQDGLVLRDMGLEVSYLPVMHGEALAAVLQTRISPEGEQGLASFALLDREYAMDSSFNGGQERSVSSLFPGTACASNIRSARLDRSRRLYLVAYTECTEFTRFYLLRFTAEGEPDADFGDGGMVVVSEGWSGVTPIEFILQSDGKPVLAQSGSQIEESATQQLLVHRYTLAGEPDLAWGDAGVVAVSDASPGYNHALTNVVYRDSGNIRLFFMRDGGTSTVELEGDAPGSVEDETSEAPASRGSSGGVASVLLLLLCLAGMRMRRKA